MNILRKLKSTLLTLKYRLFPHTFELTPKGASLLDYCKRCLADDITEKDKIMHYETIIEDLQKQTNSSRTMAIIYLMSVLCEVEPK